MDDVLAQVRNWGGDSVSPLHIIRRKDLHNIAREFHITKRYQLHRNDSASVAMWVEGHQDVCRYVKWQNEASPDGMLRVDDFMLVILTDVQVYL